MISNVVQIRHLTAGSSYAYNEDQLQYSTKLARKTACGYYIYTQQNSHKNRQEMMEAILIPQQKAKVNKQTS